MPWAFQVSPYSKVGVEGKQTHSSKDPTQTPTIEIHTLSSAHITCPPTSSSLPAARAHLPTHRTSPAQRRTSSDGPTTRWTSATPPLSICPAIVESLRPHHTARATELTSELVAPRRPSPPYSCTCPHPSSLRHDASLLPAVSSSLIHSTA